MKKSMISLFPGVILLLFSFTGFSTPQLTWRMTNPRIIFSSPTNILEFDIQIKSSELYKLLNAAQVYLKFNTDAFVNASNSDLTVTLDGQYAGKYNLSPIFQGSAASGTRRVNIGITTNNLTFPADSNLNGVIHPFFDNLITIQLKLTSSTTLLANVYFMQANMNALGAYEDYLGTTALPFVNPHLYDTKDFQKLCLERIYNSLNGWTQLGGSLNWNTSLNTSIWDSVAILNSTGALAARLRIHPHSSLSPGGRFKLADGSQLTCSDTTIIEEERGLWIKSTGSGAGGSFIDHGLGFIIYNSGGTGTVERYMSGNWTSGLPTSSTTFHEISSPISDGTINTFFGDLLNYWNEPTQSWVALTVPTTIPLNVGQGYATAPHTPGGVKTFTGTLNTGDLPISGLTRSGGTYTGFNLEGNPYPSALWFDSWSMTNLDPSVWVWDPSSGNYKIGQSSGNTLPGNIIPPENGFFVQVTSGTGSMTIPNAKRVHSSQAFYKTITPDLLYLAVNGNGYGDEMSVYFDPDAAGSYDPQYDALKLSGIAAAPQLYSILDDNTDLTINALPSINNNGTINIGFKVGIAGSDTITATGMESFANNTTIYLRDNQAKITIDLVNNPIYIFDAAPSDPENRFTLLFNPVGISEHNQSNTVNIYSYDKVIYVNVPMSVQGNILVYDLVGNQIINIPIAGNSLNKIPVNNPEGYYLVHVITKDNTYNKKVYIH